MKGLTGNESSPLEIARTRNDMFTVKESSSIVGINKDKVLVVLMLLSVVREMGFTYS